MKIKNESWTIESVLEKRDRIDPRPQYQRGSVWKQRDQELLIDSILQGFDVPKIYLRKVNSGAYDYEVADGQQRLRAIWAFADGVFALSADFPIPKCNRKYFSDLPKEYQTEFLKFRLIAAVAHSSTSSEIRELFKRLQRGVQLSQPEIRNAVPSQLGDIIRSMAATHSLFECTPFTRERYKADDMVAHAFYIEQYGHEFDLKAQQLRDMYAEFRDKVPADLEKRVHTTLDIMLKMQRAAPNCIRLKWGFVDVYGVISRARAEGAKIDAKLLAENYLKFEKRRLEFRGNASQLLTGKVSKKDRNLYSYIESFKTLGGISKNVANRLEILYETLIARES